MVVIQLMNAGCYKIKKRCSVKYSVLFYPSNNFTAVTSNLEAIRLES